jgi:Fe-S cluster assembly iron-binding protein IscA
MLEVTEKASEMIKEALKSHKNPPSIRILLQGG